MSNRVEVKINQLPSDLVKPLPDGPNREWLRQYLEDEQINRWFYYSQSMDRHIHYYKTREETTFWEARSVNGLGVKTLTYGERPYIPVGNSTSDILVVVEDIVSAIKLSKYARAVPLYGTYIPLDAIVKLTKYPNVTGIVWWLDGDKYTTATNYAKKSEACGMPSIVKSTDKDPKELTHADLEHHFNVFRTLFRV